MGATPAIAIAVQMIDVVKSHGPAPLDDSRVCALSKRSNICECSKPIGRRKQVLARNLAK